jgi:hypothetical protein
MSHQCTTFVAEHPRWRNRHPSQTLVGMILAWRHHHEKDECKMSVDEIARKAGISSRHVIRVVQQLEKLELLERPVKGNGSGHITSFVFTGFALWIASHPARRRVTPDPERVTSDAEKDDMVSAPIRKQGSTGERTSGGTKNPPRFSQDDFDARDLRRMGEAYREAAKRPESIGHLSDEEYFAWVCRHAGITVERGLYLDKKQRAWPFEFNSKRPPERAAG